MRFILAAQPGERASGAALVPKKKIAVLSYTDLFSECLTEALTANFMEYEITKFQDMDQFKSNVINNLQLVLLYNNSGFSLENTTEFIHRRYPDASVCVVIEKLADYIPVMGDLVERQTIQGILPLDLRFDVFIAAIELLTKGGEHFPAALLRNLNVDGATVGRTTARMASERSPPGRRYAEDTALTTREVQILDLICQGSQNKNIAADLNLSENTVKVHIRNIYKKMKVNNRTEAASMYFRSGNLAEYDTGKRQ
jgi:DNA-binding NarL/FixJ family response regulator